VVTLEEFAPGAIAELRSPGGRPDDVGEEDGGKHALRFRRRQLSLGDVMEKQLQRSEDRFLVA
jgi:hypothetical protein